jgi:TPP-dependent pyruvate/acetoin dehydrogenase alpha subunit
MADAKALQAVENDISTEIKAAVNFALNAPYPEPEEVTQHVYA